MSLWGLAVAGVFFAVWRYKPQWIFPRSGWGTFLWILLFLSLPIAVALYKEHSWKVVGFHVLWRFFAAGFGEEIFFRGYMQSRLNEAWGTNWQVLGVRFGWGLIITALIFAFVHVMNPVDYFNGRYDFAWGHLLALFVFPYGWLRERTGSFLAPAILHGLVDVVILVPRVLR